MKALNLILILLILLEISSCCTKQECGSNQEPTIYLSFVNITRYEMNKIIVVNRNNYNIIDSTTYKDYIYNNQLEINKYIFSNSFDFNSVDFIITYLNLQNDTLKNCSYDIVEEKIKCNKCFPFGYKKEVISTINNFRIEYNKISYLDNEIIIIKK